MKEDRICRVRRVGEEIEAIVSKNQLREAWSKIQRWFREAKGHRAPPTSERLDQTSTLREDIYSKHPPEGAPLPILVQPVIIADGPPEVGEIVAAVRKLRSGRVGGPSGMKAERLKSWLREATREKEPDTETWEKVISVTKLAFQEGYILESLMWKMMFLIPKGGREYRGIGLVDTIWKVCTSIMNSWLQSSIVLYDVLHGFQQGGTRTGSRSEERRI